MPVQSRAVTWGDRITYGAFVAFEGVLKLFPLRVWCRLGRMVGLLAWLGLPKYRRLVRRNMKILFNGQKTLGELDTLVKENFQTIFCNFIASAKAATMSDRELAPYFTIVGKENIIRSLEENGKGVICVIAHMGNWELLARIRGNFTEVSRFGSMYRELDNPLIEDRWHRRREKSGCEMFGRKTSSFANSTRILRDNGMLGILCDQNAGNFGIQVPYYGKMASTTNLPALLQRRTGAVLHPVTVRTTSLGNWEVSFGPEIPVGNRGKDIPDTTAKINAVLSGIGIQSPADGFWMHNRWKQEAVVPRGEAIAELTSDYGRPFIPFRLIAALPSRLEEGLLFLIIMRCILRARRDAEWVVLCPPGQAGFWASLPEVVSAVPKEGDWKASLAAENETTASTFDVGYMMDDDSAVPAALRGMCSAYLRGLRGEHPFFARDRGGVVPEGPPGHRLDDYAAFLKLSFLNVPLEPFYTPVRTSVPPETAPVMICPFSPQGRQAEWTRDGWAALISSLSASCILAVGEEDRDCAERLAEELGVPCVAAPLSELHEEFGKARLVVGVDGWATHLAAHAGTPTLTLFSTRSPERWAPLGDGHGWLYESEGLERLDASAVCEAVRGI